MIFSSAVFGVLFRLSLLGDNKSKTLLFLRRRNISNGFLYHQEKLKSVKWLKDYVMLDEWDAKSFSNLESFSDAKL